MYQNKTDMPTLFIIFGLRFFFYADEHLPIHVHVENADGRAKFLVYPNVEIVSNKGIKPLSLKRARSIIIERQQEIIDKWHEFHG